jgi:AmmeMemoRadiSam system protein A
MSSATNEISNDEHRPTVSSVLSSEERRQLLQLARAALADSVCGRSLTPLNLAELPPRLCEFGSTFITLTIKGQLRGCVGTLEAYQPLAEDVREHTRAAALSDYRFLPVQPDEVPHIKIEISYLTPLRPLEYDNPEDLLIRIRPGIDGVVFRDGLRRATFLPQVWEKLSNPEEFFDHLCQKMGVAPGTWRRRKLEVFTYQVEEFHE